jgi:hypothetical protein
MAVPDGFLVLVVRISLLTLSAQKARAETRFLRCQQNGRLLDAVAANYWQRAVGQPSHLMDCFRDKAGMATDQLGARQR